VCVDVTGRHHQFSSANEAIEDRKSNTPAAELPQLSSDESKNERQGQSQRRPDLDLLRDPHFVSIGTTQMNSRSNRMDWASVE